MTSTTLRAAPGDAQPSSVGATNAPAVIAPPNEAIAPATLPAVVSANAPTPGEFERTPIRRNIAVPGAGPTTAASKSTPGTGPDLMRIALALAAVLGLIFLLRWGSRKLMNAPGAGRSSQTIQVLTRAALSPRQQVVLVQVGRRLLIVADGGTQASALGQITDPDEVAALIGQIRAEKQGGAAASFGSLFGRVKGAFTGDPNGAREDAEAAELAGMPPMGGRSYDDPEEGEEAHAIARPPRRPGGGLIGASAAAAAAAEPDSDDAQAVAATRQELSGLMEKVRNLSKQFGRG